MSNNSVSNTRNIWKQRDNLQKAEAEAEAQDKKKTGTTKRRTNQTSFATGNVSNGLTSKKRGSVLNRAAMFEQAGPSDSPPVKPKRASLKFNSNKNLNKLGGGSGSKPKAKSLTFSKKNQPASDFLNKVKQNQQVLKQQQQEQDEKNTKNGGRSRGALPPRAALPARVPLKSSANQLSPPPSAIPTSSGPKSLLNKTNNNKKDVAALTPVPLATKKPNDPDKPSSSSEVSEISMITPKTPTPDSDPESAGEEELRMIDKPNDKKEASFSSSIKISADQDKFKGRVFSMENEIWTEV